MLKRKYTGTELKITVGIDELQEILSVGRNTALKVAKEAGAELRIGRRLLYNVDKIQAYILSLTEGAERGE